MVQLRFTFAGSRCSNTDCRGILPLPSDGGHTAFSSQPKEQQMSQIRLASAPAATERAPPVAV